MTDRQKDEAYQVYWDAIRRRVCSVCLDQADDGSCGLERSRVCGIEAHLPRVIEAILSVDSSRMDEYVEAIRGHVCARCENQDAQGFCKLRERGECALDSYLYLVVDAIEEVKGRDLLRGHAL